MPVPDLVAAGVAAEADPVGDLGRTLGKADDLGNVAAAVNVQAAAAMAILALHSLLLVISVLKALAGVIVTSGADFRPYASSVGSETCTGCHDDTGKSFQHAYHK